jgi:uncharacterized tellurite resistance protein B-like protein
VVVAGVLVSGVLPLVFGTGPAPVASALVGVPVLFLVAGAAWCAAALVRRSHQRRVLRMGGAARSVSLERRIVEAVRAGDPGFTSEDFKRRVSGAFIKVAEALASGELGGARAFVSDGVYERLVLQASERRNGAGGELLGAGLEDFRVHDVSIADGDLGARLQTVAVRLEASAAERPAGERAGGPRGRKLPRRRFSEYWSFVRSADMRTRPGRPGLIEGRCPNCGHPIAMSQHSACPACEAVLRSGRHDWVLAEVVQESAWAPRRMLPLQGLDRLLLEDPDFSVQHVEDRASVLFWRWLRARRSGRAEPLMPVSVPEMISGFEQRLDRERGEGLWIFGEGCIVDDVELRWVARGEEGWKLGVVVNWSGRMVSMRGGREADRPRQVSTGSIMVLVRDAGVSSAPELALSSAHCGSCGAPETEVGGNCEYCGAQLNSTAREWMLRSIQRCSSTGGQATMKELSRRAGAGPARRAGGRKGMVACAILISAADGEISAAEERALARLAANSYLPRRRFEEMLEAAREGRLEAPTPEGRAEALEWLRAMIEAALADGDLAGAEVRVMRAMASRFGISAADLRMLAARERTRAIRSARAELDAAKRAGVAERVATEFKRRKKTRRARFEGD